MSYRMSGTYFESCNCDVTCPCGASNLFLPATNERCVVLLAFHVGKGEVDGVDVGGMSVAMLADTPGQMTDGGWRVGVFLDDQATEEQQGLLTAVFSGQQGGPPALFSPLMGEMLGIEVASMEYADDGRRHSLRIGDAVDLEVEDFAAAEEGAVMTMTGVAHPVGTTLALGHGIRARIQAFGLDIDNAGKNAHSAPFSWQN